TGMSIDDKLEQGILLGKYANEAMARSDADVVITLCDDDELIPTYLRDLVAFFSNNPNINHCYSKISIYNPILQSSGRLSLDNKYNVWDGPIDPQNKVDTSQVAVRMSCFKELGVRYPESTKDNSSNPWLKNI